MPVAHEAVGQGGFLLPGVLCQRANHQFLGNPHAKAAGDEFVENESLRGIELVPGRLHGFVLFLFGSVS